MASEQEFHTVEIRWPEVGLVIESPTGANIYRIGSEINFGNFSCVFECTDNWSNELVAKVIKPNGRTFEEVQRKTIEETNALNALRHPNTVFVRDCFEFGNLFYIITDRYDFSLADMISRTNFSPAVWFKPIGNCLLQALDFIHRSGFVHCDVHPGNVYSELHRDVVTSKSYGSCNFRLGDMGLTRHAEHVCEFGTLLNRIRPPECMAPEEFGPVDHRVDIYQTGLLLLEVATWRTHAFSDEERLKGTPREVALTLDREYSQVIEPMIRRHAEFRVPTAADAWALFQQ